MPVICGVDGWWEWEGGKAWRNYKTGERRDLGSGGVGWRMWGVCRGGMGEVVVGRVCCTGTGRGCRGGVLKAKGEEKKVPGESFACPFSAFPMLKFAVTRPRFDLCVVGFKAALPGLTASSQPRG